MTAPDLTPAALLDRCERLEAALLDVMRNATPLNVSEETSRTLYTLNGVKHA